MSKTSRKLMKNLHRQFDILLLISISYKIKQKNHHIKPNNIDVEYTIEVYILGQCSMGAVRDKHTISFLINIR